MPDALDPPVTALAADVVAADVAGSAVARPGKGPAPTRTRRKVWLLAALVAFALLAVSRLGRAPAEQQGVVPVVPVATAASGYQCTGTPVALFNNFNGSAVGNGGSPPSFSTNGKTYCLSQIETYHWNGGYGMPPAQLWLQGPGGKLGPYEATGSAGQNGVLANWYANTPHDPWVIINGTYMCMDSDPVTWSSNKDSGGQGFCRVWVSNATPAGATAPP